MTAKVAQVAIEQTVYHFDKPYSYSIPHALMTKVVPGCRVMVPFGRANQKRVGVVKQIGRNHFQLDSRRQHQPQSIIQRTKCMFFHPHGQA